MLETLLKFVVAPIIVGIALKLFSHWLNGKGDDR